MPKILFQKIKNITLIVKLSIKHVLMELKIFYFLDFQKSADFTEVPICESVISCDNLVCDGYGKQPNASVVVQVTSSSTGGWIKYGRTEVIEVCKII